MSKPLKSQLSKTRDLPLDLLGAPCRLTLMPIVLWSDRGSDQTTRSNQTFRCCKTLPSYVLYVHPQVAQIGSWKLPFLARFMVWGVCRKRSHPNLHMHVGCKITISCSCFWKVCASKSRENVFFFEQNPKT